MNDYPSLKEIATKADAYADQLESVDGLKSALRIIAGNVMSHTRDLPRKDVAPTRPPLPPPREIREGAVPPRLCICNGSELEDGVCRECRTEQYDAELRIKKLEMALNDCIDDAKWNGRFLAPSTLNAMDLLRNR